MGNDRKIKCGCRSGVVLIGVLVVMAIIMVLYFVDMSAIFSPVVKKNSSNKESRPWLEEDRILGGDAVIKMPAAPKPLLDEGVSLECDVELNGSERGKVRLEFSEFGEVRGKWDCAYSHESRAYSFEAEFAGNIDIKKTYRDKSGEDESLLYFIAKGDYIKTTKKHSQEDGEIEEGAVYVTGWLGREYSCEGLITITTDRKWSVAYGFDCQVRGSDRKK